MSQAFHALLIQLAVGEEGRVAVVEGARHGWVAVTAREVDSDHEVDVQTGLNELEEGRTVFEVAARDDKRTRCKREFHRYAEVLF